MNLTPTQAALLRRGLDHLLANPDHVLESDLRRVVWVLAQCASRAIASQEQPTWPDEDTLVEFVNLCQQYSNEAVLTLWQKVIHHPPTWEALQTASDLAMQAEPPPEYLTIRQACARYGIARSTLGWHVRRGNIEAVKSDKRTWMVEAHSLAIWVSERSP